MVKGSTILQCKGFLNRLDFLAEARAEHLKVGLHGVGDVVLRRVAELDAFEVEFFHDQVTVIGEAFFLCAVAEDEFAKAERLANF